MAEESWLEIVGPIAREAGVAIRRHLHSGKNKNAMRKPAGDWVTAADEYAERFIIDKLQYYFPKHSILGEESGLHGRAKACWVIDPLDGTTNFVHGMPCFAVSIAFCQDGAPELAVLYDINHDELYTAVRGRGAFCEDKRLRMEKKMTYAESLLMASGQLGMDGGAMWRLLGRMASESEGARRSGSTVLDLAWLAAGHVDVVVSGPVRFWDVAAGSLLVREAGGLLADVYDRTQFVFNQKTACFVAANPHIFARYLHETKAFCQQQGWLEAAADKPSAPSAPAAVKAVPKVAAKAKAKAAKAAAVR